MTSLTKLRNRLGFLLTSPNSQNVICDPGGDDGRTIGRAWPGAPLEAILQFLKGGIMAPSHASWAFTSHRGAVL